MKTLPDIAMFERAFLRLNEITRASGRDFNKLGEVGQQQFISACEDLCDGHLVIARRHPGGGYSFATLWRKESA